MSYRTNTSNSDITQSLIGRRKVYSIHSLLRKAPIESAQEEQGLKKCLNAIDLIAYGVGSTVGAGIFVSLGSAALVAGPAMLLSFLLAGTAALLSAFCYAEFSVNIPVSGSAYSFTYVALGELCGWFVGWNLTLEYSISASAVARGWAGYVTKLFHLMGVDLPAWFAGYAFNKYINFSPLAVVIVLLCTIVLILGVKDSARFNLVITIVNVCTILFIIILGALYVDPSNWSPFLPYGPSGVFAASGLVFFSYIGFDSVTTLAGEVERPSRDLPIGIVGTLFIATALYLSVSLVITGMVPFKLINTDAPLAEAFAYHGLKWAATLIAIGCVTALTATTLCSILGQPRIYFQMAKDGLFFKPFERVNEKTGVPLFGTIATGIIAGTLALFLNLEILTDMISIGTLMAFTVVCAGVIILRFRLNPSSYIPKAGAGLDGLRNHIVALIVVFMVVSAVFAYLVKMEFPVWAIGISTAPLVVILGAMCGIQQTNIPKTFKCPLVPGVPLVGILVNIFLIVGLKDFEGAMLRVLIWSAIGFAIYFGYGIRHSRLNFESREVDRM